MTDNKELIEEAMAMLKPARWFTTIPTDMAKMISRLAAALGATDDTEWEAQRKETYTELTERLDSEEDARQVMVAAIGEIFDNSRATGVDARSRFLTNSTALSWFQLYVQRFGVADDDELDEMWANYLLGHSPESAHADIWSKS